MIVGLLNGLLKARKAYMEDTSRDGMIVSIQVHLETQPTFRISDRTILRFLDQRDIIDPQ